jgi:hypothetical protein
MSSSFRVELLGADDPMEGASIRTAAAVMGNRRGTSWHQAPFDAVSAWRGSSTREQVTGQLITRFHQDFHQTLQQHADWGVLIESDNVNGALLGSARVIGVGPSPEDARGKNTADYSSPNAAYFWVTT